MKIFILAVAALCAVYTNASALHGCPKSLCKEKTFGAIFQLSKKQGGYFVTCTNTGPVCRKCPANLTFNNSLKVCLRDFPRPAATSAPRCHNKLCKNKRNGLFFRLDNNKPQYFVQCNFGEAICRICPPTQYFNNRFQVCFRRTTVPIDW